jgi:predicted AAA+ superfamily ATPase
MFPSSTYEYNNRVFYWESKIGKEVDFVLKLQDQYLPIEVKYQSEVKKDDLLGLHSFIDGGSCNGGIIITKDVLKVEDGISFIPYYLFLCLI